MRRRALEAPAHAADHRQPSEPPPLQVWEAPVDPRDRPSDDLLTCVIDDDMFEDLFDGADDIDDFDPVARSDAPVLIEGFATALDHDEPAGAPVVAEPDEPEIGVLRPDELEPDDPAPDDPVIISPVSADDRQPSVENAHQIDDLSDVDDDMGLDALDEDFFGLEPLDLPPLLDEEDDLEEQGDRGWLDLRDPRLDDHAAPAGEDNGWPDDAPSAEPGPLSADDRAADDRAVASMEASGLAAASVPGSAARQRRDAEARSSRDDLRSDVDQSRRSPASTGKGRDVAMPAKTPMPPASRKAASPHFAPSSAILPTIIIAEMPRLRRFAAAMIGDEEIADQLILATVEEALGDPADLQTDRELSVSLLVILYRQRNEARRGRRRAATPQTSRRFDEILFERLPGADRDELHEFAAAMDKLEERDRALLLLTALETLDYRDLSAVIMVPVGRVMSKVAEARDQLRLVLRAEAGEEDTLDEEAFAEPTAMDLDLHGYLDGELDPAAVDLVEAYLDETRMAAEQLVHFGVQGDLIRRLYGPLINRPLPPSMAEQFHEAAKRREAKARKSWGASAAVLLALASLAIGGACWLWGPPLLDDLPVRLDAFPMDKILALIEPLRD